VVLGPGDEAEDPGGTPEAAVGGPSAVGQRRQVGGTTEITVGAGHPDRTLRMVWVRRDRVGLHVVRQVARTLR
jgi:hypothetical protein